MDGRVTFFGCLHPAMWPGLARRLKRVGGMLRPFFCFAVWTGDIPDRCAQTWWTLPANCRRRTHTLEDTRPYDDPRGRIRISVCEVGESSYSWASAAVRRSPGPDRAPSNANEINFCLRNCWKFSGSNGLYSGSQIRDIDLSQKYQKRRLAP